MDIEVIRLECLKLAVGFGGQTQRQIVEDAQMLTDFIANGKSDPFHDEAKQES